MKWISSIITFVLLGCSAMVDEKTYTDAGSDTDTDTDADTDTDTDTDADTDTDTDSDTDTETDPDTEPIPECGGTEHEGGCWYLSNVGDSCENKCEAHKSEFDFENTCGYAGDYLIPEKCIGVIQAILPGQSIEDIGSAEGPYGCIFWTDSGRMRIYESCTQNSFGGNCLRICACTF